MGNSWAWERSSQGTGVIYVILMFFVSVLFTLSLRDPTAKSSSAFAAGVLSLFAGFLGLIATSVFVSRTPERVLNLPKGAPQPPNLTEFTWCDGWSQPSAVPSVVTILPIRLRSFGLFTAAWALTLTMAPLGFVASGTA